MAQPPKKPPVLPGLPGQPQQGLPGLGQPLRPQQGSIVQTGQFSLQVSAAELMKQGAANIAKRIAGSTKHVVVLESHNFSIMQMLATSAEAAGILKKAGYHGIYFEVDQRVLRPSSANAVFPNMIKRLSSSPATGTVGAAQAAIYQVYAQSANVFQNSTPLPVHPVGDEYIAAEEALAVTRTTLNCKPLLIEQAYIAGVMAQRKKTKSDLTKIERAATDNPFDRRLSEAITKSKEAIKVFDEMLKPASGHSFAHALMDMMKLATYMPVTGTEKKEFIQNLARELRNPVTPRHVEELTLLFEQLDHFRTEGAGDVQFVTNGLAHAAGANTLFIAGAAHGASNNPLSLPNQLALQTGVAETDIQTILPVFKHQAGMFHAELVRLKMAGKLRDDLIVFDAERNTDFKVGEWLEKAKGLYAGQAIPDFKYTP